MPPHSDPHPFTSNLSTQRALGVLRARDRPTAGECAAGPDARPTTTTEGLSAGGRPASRAPCQPSTDSDGSAAAIAARRTHVSAVSKHFWCRKNICERISADIFIAVRVSMSRDI